ncbi:MAG: gamma-butyrobetaine hydroxylase-like domain-containing protein [Gammaproteobacteria bacterium]
MRLTVESVPYIPTEIILHQVSRALEISFDNGETFKLPYEYLRVYTPSAEALGHTPGEEVLQTGKEDVTIVDIQPVGSYGITPHFNDGHNSGIYTWHLLYKLGKEYPVLWQIYLQELDAAGIVRKPSPTSFKE